jgi:hypothetical protein
VRLKSEHEIHLCFICTLAEGNFTRDHWYPQAYGSKETLLRKSCQWSGCIEFRMLHSLFLQRHPTSTRPATLPQISSFHFITSNRCIHFCLAFWAPFAFGEADFHKIEGRETLSRSHNYLNTMDDNMGLTESSSISWAAGCTHTNFTFFFLRCLDIF